VYPVISLCSGSGQGGLASEKAIVGIGRREDA